MLSKRQLKGIIMNKIAMGLGLLLVLQMQVQAASTHDILTAPDRLESDVKRDVRSQPQVIVELLALKAGDRVADIFAGGGYYSEILGRVVAPGGDVLMHNNRAYINYAGPQLEQRFTAREVIGVKRHDREVDRMDLGEGELDAAIIIMSYHDLYHTADGWPVIDAAHFMGQIVRALKPGGRFLIVDHAAAAGTGKDSAQDLHRIEEAFARADVERYGLRYKGASDALRNTADNYQVTAFDPSVQGKTDRFILVFEKP